MSDEWQVNTAAATLPSIPHDLISEEQEHGERRNEKKKKENERERERERVVNTSGAAV